jgi:site-specific recombinase XerD
LEAQGGDRSSYHGLRHAFASTLIEQGRNIVQVSRLLGHHSPAFTLQVYAHVMDDGLGGLSTPRSRERNANITHGNSTAPGRTR